MGVSADGLAITPYLNSWAYEQEKDKKANGYIAFYKDKKVEVRADTSYEAQKLAAHYFRAKKGSRVTVVLVEKKWKTNHTSTRSVVKNLISVQCTGNGLSEIRRDLS